MSRRDDTAKPQPPAKRKGPGRPTLYNDAVAAHILGRLAQGYSVPEACRFAGGVPDENTVYRWLTERPDFGEAVARARKMGAPAQVDRCWTIANDASRDVLEQRNAQGELVRLVPNHAAVKRDELRVSQLRYMAARADPENYGDRHNVVHSGTVTLELGTRLEQALRYRKQLEQAIDVQAQPATIEDLSA